MIADPTPAAVHEFDPHELYTPPGNSEPTVEEVTTSGLLASIEADGQQQPGIVGDPDPEVGGKRPVYAGSRRVKVCGILGRRFRALVVPGKVTAVDLIRYRLTENLIRRTLSPFEIAADITVFVRETGCTQEEAAERFGMSAGKLSKLLTLYRKATPEVRAAVESGAICPSVGETIATLPHLTQPGLLERAAKGKLKRDVVVRIAKGLRTSG